MRASTTTVSVKAAVFFTLVFWGAVFAKSYIDIERDGNVFKLKAYTDIERSAEYVWPFVWEFRHLKGYIDNVQRIDSVAGGQDWYDVRFTGDFPFVHTEVINHKWIVEEGQSIRVRLVKSVIKSPLPIDILDSESYWRIESLGDNFSRVHFETVVKVYAAGFEVLYTGIARSDGKRIMRNFKRYVESR
jgi:hypothetical protein